MLEAPHTYPLLRGRRQRRGGRRRPAPRLLRIAGVALLAVAVLAAIILLARRASAPDPREELPRALAALDRGNYSAARNHALAASAGPDAALAHAILGRVYLALGDGVAAEGALGRAVTAGFDRRRLHQLFADAWLLQDDPDRALAEAAQALPRYAPYAIRVRARALAANDDVPGATRLLQTALVARPDDAGAWTDLGRIRFDAGDVGAADAAAQRAVALDPRRPEGLVLRGEVVRSRYGLAAAAPWFAQALTRDAYFRPALIASAATLGELGRYRAMLDATRRALAARPGDPEALYLQAVMAARAGRYDLARAMLAKAGGAGSDVPGVLLLSGALDYATGQYQQAAGSLRALVARQPTNLVARRLLGAALLRAGDAKGALETLRPIALRADADSYALTLAGRAFEATGERGWAARLLDRAARRAVSPPAPFGTDIGLATLDAEMAERPGDPAAAVAWLRGAIDSGDTARADARARAIAAASPGVPAAQTLAGDVAMAQGRAPAALAAYTRAADLRFDAPALLRLAEAADRSGERRTGAAALALYLGQNPQSLVARRALANMQLAARDWDAATETLEGLRGAIGDRDALLLAQLGYAYTGAGDPVAGARYAAAAYRLAPLTPAACDAWGWALYESGDVASALQLLRKAAAIAPAHAGIRWHLAQALAEAGRTAEARAAIAHAMADPAFADRAAAVALRKAIDG